MPREGTYLTTSVGGERVRAFIPQPLPPDPPLDLGSLQLELERANQAIGRLDALTTLLPDANLFIYGYVRREAVSPHRSRVLNPRFRICCCSRSTRASDLSIGDITETSNYVLAMTHGLERLRGGFPLSSRLLREIHGVLLSRGRGAEKTPGEFRRSQNWIGGTRPGNAAFVPPPHTYVVGLMGDLELFLNNESTGLPLLIRAGLAHVQFETVHPFPDGNGRLGRLLITFLLCAGGALREPLLYLSLYLKQHRTEYYDLLQRVRLEGVWEDWLRFFLEGVTTTALQAASTASESLRLFRDDRARIEAQAGAAAGNFLRVQEHFQTHPISSVTRAADALALSFPTVGKAVDRLVAQGVLREMTGRRRNRLYAYGRYLDLLTEGTDPLPR